MGGKYGAIVFMIRPKELYRNYAVCCAIFADNKQHEYYFGNVPKNATVEDLRSFLSDCGKISNFEYRLHKCTYCPTKIAYIKFAQQLDEKKLEELNKSTFQQKRLFVVSTKTEKFFTPLLSVVVRYLNEQITEEDLYNHFSSVGTIECVQKPSHNYAYICFTDNASIKRALELKKSLKGIEPYIVEVKRKISMFLEPKKPVACTQIKDKCDKLDLVYNPAAENETTLLVTNIPRDTEEDDVIEFLGRFGKIVDWVMQKSATSVMSNIAYVTYQHPNMARTAFLHGPLNFQGFGMEVYNRMLSYTSNDSDQTVIIRHLTNDEIFESCSEYGRVEYIQRIDATNYNTIVRMNTESAAKRVLDTRNIAGEDVVIRLYTAKQYVSTTSAPRYLEARVPPKRSRKETMLLHITDIEDRKKMSLLPTTFNPQYFNPNPQYYRNEVQVWNYAPKQGLVEFRDYFKKYGTVINMREQKEYSTSPIGVAYLSFETKLEAKRVCKLNHSFMCSRRLLILMADQCVAHDPALCVRVGSLTEEIADEDVYDRFSMIGDVRYVFRPKLAEAIVCMAKEKWQAKALKVMCVGRFPVDVSSLLGANNAQQGGGMPGVANHPPVNAGMVQYPIAIPSMVPAPVPPPTSNNQWYGAAVQNFTPVPTALRPMGPSPGSWMLAAPVPSGMPMVSGPGPIGIVRPAVPMPVGSINVGGQEVSPRMRGLMQTVEAQMIKCKNFTTLPMMDQFHLVRDIVNQCMSYPLFLTMSGEEKIRYLINEPKGFQQLHTFTLFTYPEQLQMLALIEDYYRSTSEPGTLPPPASSSSSSGNSAAKESDAKQSLKSNTVDTVLPRDAKDAVAPTESAAKANEQPAAAAAAATSNDYDAMDDDDSIPPAPSPPPLSFRSRSPSPVDDENGMWVSSSGSINGSFQQKMIESTSSAAKKRRANKKVNKLEKPMVQVVNLPTEVSKAEIEQLFSQHGKVKLVSNARSHYPNANAMIVMFDTMYQAYSALERNFTKLQERLIRVNILGSSYTPQSECGVSIASNGPYSELAIFDTFKSCGKILYMQTTGKPGNEVCLIEFDDAYSAQAALKITYLHNGNRCKAQHHSFAS
uniref:RRM domain-containing protein n=1 Tax=Anopheles maculatus TaxID=74869 RepID=A0A182T091_9DIPT